jgi:hypothetical protein
MDTPTNNIFLATESDQMNYLKLVRKDCIELENEINQKLLELEQKYSGFRLKSIYDSDPNCTGNIELAIADVNLNKFTGEGSSDQKLNYMYDLMLPFSLSDHGLKKKVTIMPKLNYYQPDFTENQGNPYTGGLGFNFFSFEATELHQQ